MDETLNNPAPCNLGAGLPTKRPCCSSKIPAICTDQHQLQITPHLHRCYYCLHCCTNLHTPLLSQHTSNPARCNDSFNSSSHLHQVPPQCSWWCPGRWRQYCWWVLLPLPLLRALLCPTQPTSLLGSALPSRDGGTEWCRDNWRKLGACLRGSGSNVEGGDGRHG